MNRINKKRLERLAGRLSDLDELVGAALQHEVPKAKDDPNQFVGPLSPQQLAQLDRALTPAEQKAVEDWQEQEANQQLADERAKGGPRSETVSVTEKGAVIRATPRASASSLPSGRPWWQWALLAGGILGLGTGIYLVASTPKHHRRPAWR